MKRVLLKDLNLSPEESKELLNYLHTKKALRIMKICLMINY